MIYANLNNMSLIFLLALRMRNIRFENNEKFGFL